MIPRVLNRDQMPLMRPVRHFLGAAIVALAVMGCGGDPVENCPDAPDRDCCTENVQCLDYYGLDFPYCVGGDRAGGGVCSQCARDDHCVGECDIVEDFGVCI